MAGHLRLGHGELHVGEEPARAALADQPLCLLVRPSRRGPDDVQSQLVRQPLQFDCPHSVIVPSGITSLSGLLLS